MMFSSKRERAGRRGAPLCRLVLMGLGVLSLVVTGCGGTQHRAAEPSAPTSSVAEDDELRAAGDAAPSSADSSAEPSTAQGALEAFERAAGRFASLSRGWGPSGGGATANGDVDGAKDPAPSVPSAAQDQAQSEAKASEKKSRTRAEREGQMCTRACEAFASMKRSAARLCTLVGEAGDTCQSVRERLGSARERVRASCPACEAARHDEP